MRGLLAATSLALVAGAATAAPTPVARHASPEECAVIVEIGRAKAAWGPRGPNEAFVIEDREPNGARYRQDCDWKKFGVGAPRPPQGEEPRFSISRPAFGSGGSTATADLAFIAPRGPRLGPFVSVETCSLRKTNGRWRLVSCEQRLIT